MSETTAYRNHIKNSKIVTREVFEWETWSPQTVQRTLPTNSVTRLDNNQLARSTDSSNHEKRTNQRRTQTQNCRQLIRQRHHHWTQEQRRINARIRKSVVSIGKITCQTHLRATTLILLIKFITDASDASDAKIRSIRKGIQSKNAQL